MFSFRTYLRPLKVLEQRTDVMQRLLAAFMALPEEVVTTHAYPKDRILNPKTYPCWRPSWLCLRKWSPHMHTLHIEPYSLNPKPLLAAFMALLRKW